MASPEARTLASSALAGISERCPPHPVLHLRRRTAEELHPSLLQMLVQQQFAGCTHTSPQHELCMPNPSLLFCLCKGQHRTEPVQPAPSPRGSIKQTATGKHCSEAPADEIGTSCCSTAWLTGLLCLTQLPAILIFLLHPFCPHHGRQQLKQGYSMLMDHTDGVWITHT